MALAPSASEARLSYGISGSGGFARGVRGFAFRFLFSGDRFTFLQLFLLRHRPELQVKIREDTDKERAAYYYENTGKTWDDVNDYHMILDTSELGVDNCANILMQYFERLEYI